MCYYVPVIHNVKWNCFTCSQATIPFMNGTEKWKANIFLIPRDSALVSSIGPLDFTLRVLSILCLHSTSQRLFFHFLYAIMRSFLIVGAVCHLHHICSLSGYGSN